jgi:hypothetical protein
MSSSSSSSSSAAPAAFFNEEVKGIQFGSYILSGLCPVLKRNFYPDFNYVNAVKKDCDRAAISMIPKKGAAKTKRVPIWVARKWKTQPASVGWSALPTSSSYTQSTKPDNNRDLGVLLDNEVTELVKLVNDEDEKKRVEMRKIFYWCYPAQLAASSSDSKAETTLSDLIAQNKVTRWLPHTKALVKFLYNQQWTPYRSQLVVGDVALGVGTKMDLLCLDLVNKLYIVVENKVGYDYMECHTKGASMRWPFTDLDDSIRNQHHLQTLGTALLFERTAPAKDPSKVMGVIIRYRVPHQSSDDVALEVEPLDEAISNKKAALLYALQRVAPAAPRSRSKKKKKEASL